MIAWEVLGLDVWGHGDDECSTYDCGGECEGFTVNDVSKVGTIELADDATDLETFRVLQAHGYLGNALAPSDVKFDWPDEEYGECDLASNGRPLLQFRKAASES